LSPRELERETISNHLSPRGLEACRPDLFGVLGGLLRLMDAWRGSRKSHDEKRGEIHHDDEGRTTMTMKRKMDENDAGADEVM